MMSERFIFISFLFVCLFVCCDWNWFSSILNFFFSHTLFWFGLKKGGKKIKRKIKEKKKQISEYLPLKNVQALKQAEFSLISFRFGCNSCMNENDDMNWWWFDVNVNDKFPQQRKKNKQQTINVIDVRANSNTNR